MTLSQLIMEQAGLDPQREPPYLFPGNRWTFLPLLFDAAGFRTGAEIGVGGGRFSKRLCESVPNLRLYSIDPWRCYGHYEARYNQAQFDRDYRKAKEVLAPYDCTIIRAFSKDAVGRFPDESLDFVHIDANEDYDHVTEDLRLWTPKVKRGGIVSGLCYYNFRDHTYCQVKDAVDEWTRAHRIDPWFVLVHPRYPAYVWERQ